MSGGELITHHPRVIILVTQCAWCRALKVGGRYIHIPGLSLLHWHRRLVVPFLPTIAVSASHSACPSCAERVIANQNRRTAVAAYLCYSPAHSTEQRLLP